MAVKKERSNIAQEKLDAYDRLIAPYPAIERKGATVPYTSFNGHMFSNFEKDGSFSLRLPPDSIGTFLKKYKTSLAVSYGIIRKEYVLVPDKLLLNTKELQPYFAQSFQYVKSLKPK